MGLFSVDYKSIIILHKNQLFVNDNLERKVYHMDMDKIVCNCYSITNGGIKEAVDNGATTLEEVQEITGAGTICGACLDDVKRLVDEFVAERK